MMCPWRHWPDYTNIEMKFDIFCMQFASVDGTKHKDSLEKKTPSGKFCSGDTPSKLYFQYDWVTKETFGTQDATNGFAQYSVTVSNSLL